MSQGWEIKSPKISMRQSTGNGDKGEIEKKLGLMKETSEYKRKDPEK